MILKNMENVFNEQIVLEGYVFQLYLFMVLWCDVQGLEGCVQFMYCQFEEECMYMLKIFYYFSEVDVFVKVLGIDQFLYEFDLVQVLFEQVYYYEQKVMVFIYKLFKIGYDENDYIMFNFLQWYVEEQWEEEVLMCMILDCIKLIGGGL